MKNLKNLGKALNKAEQKLINGGRKGFCCEWCPDGTCSYWVSSPRINCPFLASSC